MFIATIIATDRLNGSIVDAAHARLVDAGCDPADWHWIDKGHAADLPFATAPDAARTTLDRPDLPYDVVVQAAEGREKKLLVADMDSTMITVECIDELADYAGLKPQIAAVTEAAMRGELDFAEALDARVALLAGLDAAVIDRCLAERVTLMSGARTLVQTMRARGAKAILVSGGFTRFAEPVAAQIGFDVAIANVLEIANGALTGTVRKPIVDSSTKERTLIAARTDHGLGYHETLAVGDGANDLAMIGKAGLGVAYHAKPVVAAAAQARIDRNDLTALLYAQGIARRDWVQQ